MTADRSAILETLAKQRGRLEDWSRSLDATVLTTPCTASEDPDGEDWSPKDHLAHLLRIERAFLAMAKLTIKGDPAPVKIGGSTMEEKLAQVHRDNESHVVGQRPNDLEAILADLASARADTLAFIETLTDEQLDQPMPGAPWADGTIGGVLMANAGHEHMHISWVGEGLAAAEG